jgi:putative transposase
MTKAYRYKLVPNKAQRYALARTMDVCRELYNDALAQRNYNYRSGNRCYRMEQSAELPELKAAFPVHKNVYSQVLQHVLDRLDKSFKNFFRSGFGFPRFKGANRFHSFTYPQSGFSLNGKRLSLSKIGNVKVRLSRELPTDAAVKTCTIKHTVSGWFAIMTFEHKPIPLPQSDLEVGIDVGIVNFAALSDGSFVPNQRFYQSAQAELRRAQRRVSRRKKGSNRRRKAVVLLRKVHERIASRRLDFLHKETTKIVRKFGLIAIEDLNVAGMARGNLAKQILDASWSTWKRLLSYKAEEAGRTKAGVPPQHTSQECDACEYVDAGNRKSQSEFECLRCSHADHADTNGAKRILARALKQLGRTVPSNANATAVMAA